MPNLNAGFISAIYIGGISGAYAVCSGTVVDEFDEPAIGAAVKVKGTTIATSTDIDGNFSISNCQSGKILQISYIGYTTLEHCMGEKTTNLQFGLCIEDDFSGRTCGTSIGAAGTGCGGGSTGGGDGCTTPLPCTACIDTEWASTGTAGYESRTIGGTCSGNSCTSNGTCTNRTTEYRCADGYVGRPDIKNGELYFDKYGFGGCTQIPSCAGQTCCGVVLDASDNNRVITGATIVLKPQPDNALYGIATDHNGIYQISNCNAGQTMYVYMVGYVRQGLKLSMSNMYGNVFYLSEDPDMEYPCDDGYYTDWSTGTGKCTICPANGNIAAQLPQSNAVALSVSGEITDCYIPKNTNYSDNTGTYQYTSNCYYAK